MTTTGPVQDMREERGRQRQQALEALEALARRKSTLMRPVFFVPGWRDEDCVCWSAPYRRGDMPIKDWLRRAVTNPDEATYVTFSDRESKQCTSFFDFADYLKERIWARVGRRGSCDIVGHSMGGLDAVAAIIDDFIDKEEPLTGVHHLITVSTPHQGSELGGLVPLLRKYPPHQAIQGVNLDPDEAPIRFINTLDVRRAVLERIHQLHCLLGTRDMVVMGGARFKPDELDLAVYREKVSITEIAGARHSGAIGITQDPRLIVHVLRALLDIPLETPQRNFGYLYQKIQRPPAAGLGGVIGAGH